MKILRMDVNEVLEAWSDIDTDDEGDEWNSSDDLLESSDDDGVLDDTATPTTFSRPCSSSSES
jgi:hypothetical protein